MTNFGCSVLAFASSNQTVITLLRGLVKDGVLDEHASSVPWAIVNKYYTADVQFVVHRLSAWVLNKDELQAPAVLFVWTNGEPYKEQVHKLSEQLLPHEFEVALAIRLPPTDPSSPAVVEDEQDIDGYLSSKGFEFVDVLDLNASSPVSDRSSIPGVPRVIDALSTIMWPSMVRQTPERDTASGFIGTIRSSNTISSDNYDELVQLVGREVSKRDNNRLKRELDELERWLNEDVPSTHADARSSDGEYETDPWSTVVTPGTTGTYASSDVLESSRPSTPNAGFDDDFASFVSASLSSSAGGPQASLESSSSPRRFPPLASESFSSTFSFDTASSGRSTPTFDDHASFNTSHLMPGDMAPGLSYRSLGSVSDFGETDKETSYREHSLGSGDDEDDEDMPSKAEIAETSRAIFCSLPCSLSPTEERGSQSVQTQATVSSTSGSGTSQGRTDKELDAEMTDGDPERFDLQSVLGALQGLKEEIAGMPDKERRRAAARVALGLVYGLGNVSDAN
ncbi:hypothetical protein BS17DRAFT_259037 [Gyrodon lividus]|nr:hypothetical protein BS17DRAFT_259037 [Gyrodon lividus]